MKEKNDMRGFLVRKFLQIICVIALGELCINLVYSVAIFPYLRNHVGGPLFARLGEVHYGSGALYMTFFWIAVEAVLSIVPDFIAKSAHHFIDTYFSGSASQELGKMFRGNVTSSTDLYYLGCMLILFVLVIIALLPYILGAICFSRITHRQMEQIWEEEKKQQQDYDRRRSLMLSDIAHDLKTPITTINGYAQALRDDVVTEEQRKKQYLNAICNKSQRMDDLISLLFEYVKIDSEGFSLHREKTDIVEFVRENIALFYADFERKDIELVIDLPESCIWWQIDKLQFARALANLFNNGLRHVEKGGEVLIRLHWDEELSRVYILFGDKGKQIPDEIAKHIFEPFVMGDASRSTKGGSGLGLSISSKIVKMHGGRLLLDRNSTEEYTKAFVIALWN